MSKLVHDSNPSPTSAIKRSRVNKVTVMVAIATLTTLALIALASPAFAHHATGGRTPTTGLEGFISGLAHPILGLDHFAFVVAVGLLAATQLQGISIPIAFLIAALGGTWLHLISWNLPAPELVISLSVLLFGWLLAREPQVRTIGPVKPLFWLSSLAAIAGLFHGYAYGEAIVGSGMTALGAYLIGFTMVQCAIALAAFQVGRRWRQAPQSVRSLQFAGTAIAGAGAAFLSTALLTYITPA